MSQWASETLAELSSHSAEEKEKVEYLLRGSEEFWEAGEYAESGQVDEEIWRLLGELPEDEKDSLPYGWLSGVERSLRERQGSQLSPLDSGNELSDQPDDDLDLADEMDDWQHDSTHNDQQYSADSSGLEIAEGISTGATEHLSEVRGRDISSDRPRDISNSTHAGAHTATEEMTSGESWRHDSVQSKATNESNLSLSALGPQETDARTATALNALNTKNSPWFEELISTTHPFMSGPNGKFKLRNDKKIKIAVLDSGIALSNADERYNLNAFRESIAAGKSFYGSPGEWNQDDYGHGTAVASVILKTAPNAILYIARVLRYDPVTKHAWPDKDAVAEAIVHAADVWKVDIINMSFGWPPNDHPGVRKAIEHARKPLEENGITVRKRVLLLAATSNFGVRKRHNIYFPSRSKLVISVDAADDDGNNGPCTSSTEDKTGNLRFTAPGVDVHCNWPLHKQPKGTLSGTLVKQTGASIACGVASGVAALVLEFGNQEPCSWVGNTDGFDHYLREDRGIESVFLAMSVVKSDRRFNFLDPWISLSGTNENPSGGEAFGASGARRWEKAIEIAKLLDHEFGAKLYDALYSEEEVRRGQPEPNK